MRDKWRNKPVNSPACGGVLLLGATLVLAAAACGDSIRPAARPLSFHVRAPRILAEGTDIWAFAVADIDGDGHRDVVAASFEQLLSLRGDGTGGLDQPVSFGRFGASFLVLGDLNKDGRADLIAPGADRGNVRVQLARGDGTFTDQILYGLSNVDVVSLALADMNGDAALDIVGLATSFQSGQGDFNALAVLPNQGDGTFGEAVTFGFEDAIASLVVADFDRDGRPDAAGVAVESGKVVLMRNEGNGVISAPVPIAKEGTAMAGMTAGDIDGDKRIDLIALNADGGSGLQIMRNLGGGAFAQPVLLPSPAAVSTLAPTADFDGDGRADIAACSSAGNLLLWRSSSKTTGAFDPVESYVSGGYAHGLVPEDVDGDGDIDLLAANSTGLGGNLALLLNDGTGRFQAAPLETDSLGASGISVFDLDHDGRTEVVAPVSDPLGAGSLVVLEGQATTRRLKVRTRFATPGLIYTPPAIGDLNGDNRADIVLPDESSMNVSVALGNPDGSFAPPSSLAADFASRVRLGDVNGDSRLDLVLASNSNPGAMGLMLGNGRGSFGPLSMTSIGPMPPQTFLLADVTGDAQLDIVATVQDIAFLGTIAVLFNDGAGKFLSNLSVTISELPLNGLAVADFDRSGTADVFTTTAEETGKASLLFGAANNKFFVQRSLTFKGMATVTVTDDLDRDGWPDLVVAVPFLAGVELLMNDPDGRFSRRHFLGVGAEPTDLATGDVDGDGDVDIIVLTAGGIVVLWNDG